MVGTGGFGVLNRFGVDATVDFDALGGFDPFFDFANFGEDFGHEFLAGEAGDDGHDEDQIDVLEDGEYSLDGRGGVEGDADVAAEFVNFPGDENRIGGDLDVEGDVVAARFDDRASVAKRIGDHEV